MARYLFIRLSPELRRRIAIAAAHEEMVFGRYCRRVLEKWLVRGDGNAKPTAVEGESGPYTAMRIPASDGLHRAARVMAANLEVSVNVVCVRILEASTPHEVEFWAAAMNGSGGGSGVNGVSGVPSSTSSAMSGNGGSGESIPSQPQAHQEEGE